jgi:hypothetical protein
MKWLAVGLLLFSILHADQSEQDQPKIPVHRFQLGPDLFWSHCRSGFERDNKGMKLTASTNGYYVGLRAGYDYLQPDALYAGTEVIVAWGRESLHKRNSRSHLSPCTSCESDRSVHEHQTRLWANAEQRLGYNAQSTLFPQFIATPYLGIGWHYEGTSNDHAFWYYGAAGLKTIQKFYKKFELGMDLKALFAFDIHDKGFVSITTTQGKKTFWGFEAAIPLRWLIGNSGKWNFEFKPYLLKLNLNSPQTIVGARLMLGYSF